MKASASPLPAATSPENPRGFLAGWLPILSIAFLWIALHIAPILRADFDSQWELHQARGLLDYGFLQRGGALLEPAFDTGRMAFPSDVNYTHHPHLMVWFYTLLYAIGGTWLCYAYLLTLRFVATLVLYELLRRFFSVRAAWWATVFYFVAPAAMAMDLETNIIGIAAAYWPIAAWLANRVRETGRGYTLFGFFIFFGGQTSWLFLSLLPALIWLATPDDVSWKDIIRRPLKFPAARTVLLAGSLSAVAFLLQMLLYTKDWQAAAHYLSAQMGMSKTISGDTAPGWKMTFLVLARTGYYVGPTLCLGFLAGVASRRSEKSRRIVESCLVFVVGFAFVEMALRKFCFIEVSPYTYLLAPVAVLAAAGLDRCKSTIFLGVLVVLSCLSFTYFTVRDMYPRRTTAVGPLAEAFARNTQKDNIILTNFTARNPPFPSWDNYGPDLVRTEAGRFIYYNVNNEEELKSCRERLKRNFQNIVFAYAKNSPLDRTLQEWLKSNGQLYRTEKLEIPPEQTSLGSRIQLAIWSMTNRFVNRASSDSKEPYHGSLEFYRMTF